MREVLGESTFFRLTPDWKTSQAEEVRSSCIGGEHDVFVAVADGRSVGFAAVALNAFHEGMGVVQIIAVDPDYQRRGISRLLMDRSEEHMRASGMDTAAVGTGGDPGHGPARAAYEAFGYTLLPSAR
jgi:GNAT superfamily N-acetyltransferase